MSNDEIERAIRELREERALALQPPPDLTEVEREQWIDERLQSVSSIDADISELEQQLERARGSDAN